MPIEIIHGDILTTGADFVVIPADTCGQFDSLFLERVARRWPALVDDYRAWLKDRELSGGDVMIWNEPELLGPRPVMIAVVDWLSRVSQNDIDAGVRRIQELIRPGSTIAFHGGFGERLLNTVFGKEHNLELWVLE